ncbi:MAG: hypothetical protein DWQ05_13505 [Calditrichaeota bacterium]|nr:MAG: hypothetical protein DWQ05_13505 [Calditrichota bacterium]
MALPILEIAASSARDPKYSQAASNGVVSGLPNNATPTNSTGPKNSILVFGFISIPLVDGIGLTLFFSDSNFYIIFLKSFIIAISFIN